jgi:hypothetical protein
MALKDAAKTFAGFLIWIVLMIVIGAIGGILLAGTLWLVSIIEPIAMALAVTGIVLLIPFLLVSAVFRRTRRLCGHGTVAVSYLWGAALWMWAMLVLYHLWGSFGLVVGLVLLGIGSVPMACTAMLFHGEFAALAATILALLFTFGVRSLGVWIAAKADHRLKIDESAQPQLSLPIERRSLAKKWLTFIVKGRPQRGSHLSAWTVGQAFSEERESVGLSSTGQISTPVSAQSIEANRGLGDAVEIRDIEDPWLTRFIHIRANTGEFIPQQAASFGWSPDGRNLVVGTCTAAGEPDILAYLDVRENRYVRLIGGNISEGSHIAWSHQGSYVAVSSRFSDEDDPLRLWRFQDGGLHYCAFFESKNVSEDLLGFRALAFAPSDGSLAAVAEVAPRAANILAHWDEVFLFEVPGLRILRRINPPDNVVALSWRADQRHLVMCGPYERTFMLDSTTGEVIRLPFQASICCCHPTERDICAFAGGGRIAIGRLSDFFVIDERPFSDEDAGTFDMCWSRDGSKLYAASGTGRTYIYTLPNW